jgi:hypothetical protein
MNVTVTTFPAGLTLLIPMDEVDPDIAIRNPDSVIGP